MAMTFRELSIGQPFDFIEPGNLRNSFFGMYTVD